LPDSPNVFGATTAFHNEDYEPPAIARDRAVEKGLAARGIEARSFLDHVYFGAGEVARADGSPYRVFTPFRRRWLEKRMCEPRLPVPSESALAGKLLTRAQIGAAGSSPTCEEFGYRTDPAYPCVSEIRAQRRLLEFLTEAGAIDQYATRRDFPALDGTSRLSPHLRAGTIGIRTCIERAMQRAQAADALARASIETWISELIWRDFYQAVLKQFPHVANGPFLEAAKDVPWRSSEGDFAAWCEGETGFPIVDAAMRQLNRTGWMHNRLRMIVASFLAKDLLLDWRSGERYFEQHLADADLAQNNGGWQWAASTGTDAVPYFRIFNPIVQGKRFDPSGEFVRRMLPQLAPVPDPFVHEPWRMPPMLQRTLGTVIGKDYPAPMVDHREARERAVIAFRRATGESRVLDTE
jgi:deoxyribodipyrimidine photo-lyase